MTEIKEINLDQIKPSKWNRKIGGFDPEKLQQLADSIKDLGVQQPIIIRTITNKNGNSKYELVAGERRWRACKIAGLQTVPCIIRTLTEVEVIKIQTVENLQRVDVHPLDEAEGFSRLIEKADYTVEQIAQELGKSISYIYQRLKLLTLIEPARKLFVDNEITAGHAILIARLAPAQQQIVLDKLLFKNYLNDDKICSVRALNNEIQERILLSLSRVSWKLNDPEILPTAGSCKECSKQTGSNPHLFADLFADVCKQGKQIYCTDRLCFQEKAAAIVNRRKEELISKNETFLKVIQGYSYEESKEKNVLSSYEWRECKKKDEGAQRVLIVAGETPGRLTYGKQIHSSYNYNTEKTPEEKEQEKKEKMKRKKAMLIRQEIYDQTVNKLADKKIEKLPSGVLKIVVKKAWTRVWNEFQKRLAKQEEWDIEKNSHIQDIGLKHIEELNDTKLILFLVKITLIEELSISQWEEIKDSVLLNEVANLCDIDVKLIKKQIKI